MTSRSIQGASPEEIRTALDSAMAEGFRPTLAIVFMSTKLDRKAIRSVLTEKGLAIFGVTTNGEFINENHSKESTAILLLDIDPAHFKILISGYPDKNYREVAARLAEESKQYFKHPAFLIAGSNMETDAEQLLFGFEDAIGRDVNIFGGMAGDDYQFREQFVFTNEEETNRGLVVLALDEEKIQISGRSTCGWKAVGTEKTVTKSEGNHVYTIDDVPVLDITAKYGGIEHLSEQNMTLMMEIATNFPLQLQREKGDPVMRPGLLVDWSDRSFYCSGTVPQGSKIRFSLPPDFDVIEKSVDAARDMQAREMPDADALVIFSCAGRLLALGPMMNAEIEGIRKVWNVPMVGMFSNAELGRATGGNVEMHNLTTCCVALKEK
jgi:hypothetical protein